MTQEERKLLLADLCGRIPYNVKISIDGGRPIVLTIGDLDAEAYNNSLDDSVRIKPYLRPMSSMTEEEKRKVHYLVESHKLGNCSKSGAISDYLNSIHIDYRGLIEKNLALEAPEGMYNTK